MITVPMTIVTQITTRNAIDLSILHIVHYPSLLICKGLAGPSTERPEGLRALISDSHGYMGIQQWSHNVK